MKRWMAGLLLPVLLSGCLSQHILVLSDKQIRDRYAKNTAPPVFGTLKSGSQHLFYALHGDTSKPLLVMVHGAPGRWYTSINLFDDSTLLSRYRILAFDRPGYGKSYPGWSLTSIQAQADHIDTLVQHLNTNGLPVTVIGRSFGTAIAACYAMQHPEKVKKLVLIGSCIDPDKEKYFWFSFANVLGPVQAFMPGAVNVATDEKFTHEQELKKILHGWERITSPTHVLHGTKDWIAKTENAWFAYNHIVNAPVTVYMLPGAGHNITFINPALIIDILMKED